MAALVAAEGQGAVDGHQDALGRGPAPGAVAVLAEDHRRADHAFGQVVVPVGLGAVQEGEQAVLPVVQAFGQARGVGVGVPAGLSGGQRRQSPVDPLDPRRAACRGAVRSGDRSTCRTWSMVNPRP